MTDNGSGQPARQTGVLRRYGAVGLFLLATVAILVAAVGAFTHYAGDAREAEENDLLAISDLKRAAIEAHIAERIADGRVLGQRTSTQTILESGASAKEREAAAKSLATAMEQTRDAYGYRRIALLDAELRPVVPAGAPALSSGSKAALAKSVALREPALVDLALGETGEPVYGVAVPVFDRAAFGGPPIGAVYLELNAAIHLYPIVAQWPNPRSSAESVLYRRDGDAVVALSPLRKMPASAPFSMRLRADDLSLIAVRALDAPKGAFRDALDYRRNPVLGAAAPIKGTPWHLVSKVDLDEAEESISDLRHAISALAATFILLAGSLTWLFWKTQQQRAALVRSELSASVQTTTDAYVRFDSARRFVDVNAITCGMTGYTREELLRMRLDDFEGSMTPEVIEERFARILGGEAARFQTTWKRRDGSLVNLDVSTTATRTTEGTQVIGFMRDMTPIVEATRERDAAARSLVKSESRFQNIFDVSPVAVQIHAADGRLLAINRAHERLFGYTQEELRDIHGWFEHAYPDPVFREKTRADFAGAIASLRAGGPVFDSEELTIRCKDGSERIAVASVSIAGDDVVATWSDLTAVRRGEQALRDSERRFRGMVEQSISGFYVVQDDRIVYANRRLGEILGRDLDAIIGHDAAEFVPPDAQAKVKQGRKELSEGVHVLRFEMPVIRGDGQRIIVAVTAARGSWNDRPASIAIVEDVTERTLAAAKIADYVKRLEHSMRGTLNAVARMVDLRDPYTAGHQRRVGLIAADIARELGWPEERAITMELIGLVHDIGKIAVPAEILSKPSKLTDIEYEIIKNHAQASYDILKDVSFDVPVADIIVQHHERLDGSGYPKGLKGDQISPEGRLLAIADVLESMASHRPYRPALGIEVAIEELERNRDRFYDGAMVDALKALVGRGYKLPS